MSNKGNKTKIKFAVVSPRILLYGLNELTIEVNRLLRSTQTKFKPKWPLRHDMSALSTEAHPMTTEHKTISGAIKCRIKY